MIWRDASLSPLSKINSACVFQLEHGRSRIQLLTVIMYLMSITGISFLAVNHTFVIIIIIIIIIIISIFESYMVKAV